MFPFLLRSKDKILALWLAFIMMAEVKGVVSPWLPWAATLGLFVLLPARSFWRARWQQVGAVGRSGAVSFGLALLGFSALVLFTGVFHGQYVDAVKYFSKYFFLLLVFALFVLLRLDSSVLAKSLRFALVVSGLCLVASMVLGYGLVVYGDGRIGFFLNEPGSLWKVGGYIFIYFAYRFLEDGRASAFGLAAVSLFLVGMDGSRSALLNVLMGYFLLFAWHRLDKQRLPSFKKTALLIFVFLLGFGGLPLMANTALAQLHRNNVTPLTAGVAFSRLAKLEDASAPRGLPRKSDAIRKQMVVEAFRSIGPHPLGGGGINYTKIQTAFGPEVVHMAYLQIWGDYGWLAMLCYFAALLSFVQLVRSRLSHRGSGAALPHSAGVLLGLYVMLSYLLYGLFNPVSNEPSEWGVYLLALSALVAESGVDQQCAVS